MAVTISRRGKPRLYGKFGATARFQKSFSDGSIVAIAIAIVLLSIPGPASDRKASSSRGSSSLPVARQKKKQAERQDYANENNGVEIAGGWDHVCGGTLVCRT